MGATGEPRDTRRIARVALIVILVTLAILLVLVLWFAQTSVHSGESRPGDALTPIAIRDVPRSA